MDTKHTTRVGPGIAPYCQVPDHREIERRVRLARQMQSEALAQLFTDAASGAARLGRALAAALTRWRRRRALQRELAAYSDRELDELGIRRPDIPKVVREHPVPQGSG